MYTLGLGGSSHDFSAALSFNSDLLVAIEDERLTRRKGGHTWWYEYPCKPSIDYCLKAAGVELSDINSIVTSDLSPRRLDDYLPNVKYFNHHLCHAASIRYLNSNQNMQILVVDGMGSKLGKTEYGEERETISFFNYKEYEVNLLAKSKGFMPSERDHFSKGISNSLGYIYNLFTRIIGFGKSQEGKTMGLAAYGQPIYKGLIYEYLSLTDDLNEALIFDPLNSDIVEVFLSILSEKHYSHQVKSDIAASVQAVFEEAIIHMANISLEKNTECFGYAGGCALNSVANQKLEFFLNSKGVELSLFPHVGDAGIAFGAIFLEELNNQKGPYSLNTTIRGSNDYRKIKQMGRPYSRQETLDAFNQLYPKIDYQLCSNPAAKIAELLNLNEIVALHHGRSEFGPRALGGRSLLSNPLSAETRSLINRKIKFREPFRPIAPMIIEEKYSEYFEGQANHEYMINLANVKEDKVDDISSVVHIDGTARVQTISKALDPFVHEIICKFEALSGIPVVCNTSFNQAEEPIVETPEDALKTFLSMDINYLFIDDIMFFKAAS